MAKDIHSFDDTVIAVLDTKPAVSDAIEGLAREGFEYEVIQGEEGREHLDPTGEEGVVATVKRLISAFGDQYRILEQLDDELAEGKIVVSVKTEPDEAAEAVKILQDHGGHFIWKLGTWTFTPIGE